MVGEHRLGVPREVEDDRQPHDRFAGREGDDEEREGLRLRLSKSRPKMTKFNAAALRISSTESRSPTA